MHSILFLPPSENTVPNNINFLPIFNFSDSVFLFLFLSFSRLSVVIFKCHFCWINRFEYCHFCIKVSSFVLLLNDRNIRFLFCLSLLTFLCYFLKEIPEKFLVLKKELEDQLNAYSSNFWFLILSVSKNWIRILLFEKASLGKILFVCLVSRAFNFL